MKTSNERRRVAERLRDAADYPGYEIRYMEQFIGELREDVFSDLCSDADYSEIFQRLADLIDPTCRDIGDIHVFVCSKCGCELDVDDREGEPTMWDGGAPAVPRYCPNCGSRVVNGDE